MNVRRQENECVAAANDMVLRLLSIDDDPAILALVKKVFECEPVEIFVAGNAPEGLVCAVPSIIQFAAWASFLEKSGNLQL